MDRASIAVHHHPNYHKVTTSGGVQQCSSSLLPPWHLPSCSPVTVPVRPATAISSGRGIWPRDSLLRFLLTRDMALAARAPAPAAYNMLAPGLVLRIAAMPQRSRVDRELVSPVALLLLAFVLAGKGDKSLRGSAWKPAMLVLTWFWPWVICCSEPSA
jgi:hypothetical protein